ncbi:MAG: ribosomal protein S18-alanine N-acetyltransferase [Clostridia bacterium]|nr:ribosomal protein S18-alanine N-acetyltransferase [Clostridia bacterium]
MEIRKAVPADAPDIAEAEALIFPDPWSERDISDLISTEGGMCYVAREGEVLIAYLVGRVIIPEGEIYRIATIPEKRGRGIAYRLLDYGYKTERGHGLETLFLEVRTRNLAARSLYRAYGFCEAGIRKNYYRDPVDDAIIMLKACRDDLIN